MFLLNEEGPGGGVFLYLTLNLFRTILICSQQRGWFIFLQTQTTIFKSLILTIFTSLEGSSTREMTGNSLFKFGIPSRAPCWSVVGIKNGENYQSALDGFCENLSSLAVLSSHHIFRKRKILDWDQETPFLKPLLNN